MKRPVLALAVASLAILAFVATVSAASPAPTPTTGQVQARATLPAILGLTQAEIMDLRHDGLSLAQIAERQKVDPQRLIDALVTQWTTRIDARVAAGALTADQAATLTAQLAVRAKAMVDQATLGGMRGAAVGAGPGSGAGMGGAGMGRGAGMGGRAASGTCPCGAAGVPGQTAP